MGIFSWGLENSSGLRGDEPAAALDLALHLVANRNRFALREQFARDGIEADELDFFPATRLEQFAEQGAFAHAFDLGVEREDIDAILAEQGNVVIDDRVVRKFRPAHQLVERRQRGRNLERAKNFSLDAR